MGNKNAAECAIKRYDFVCFLHGRGRASGNNGHPLDLSTRRNETRLQLLPQQVALDCNSSKHRRVLLGTAIRSKNNEQLVSSMLSDRK